MIDEAAWDVHNNKNFCDDKLWRSFPLPSHLMRSGVRILDLAARCFPLKDLPCSLVLVSRRKQCQELVIKTVRVHLLPLHGLHDRDVLEKFMHFAVREMIKFEEEFFAVRQSFAHRCLQCRQATDDGGVADQLAFGGTRCPIRAESIIIDSISVPESNREMKALCLHRSQYLV